MSDPDAQRFAVEIHPPDWKFPAGKTWVGGWFFAGKNRFISDLRLWIDGRAFLGLSGLPKPGWDEHLLGRPGPPYSGFVCHVEPHRGARLLRIEARDHAGSWTEFFRHAITVAAEAPALTSPPPLAARLPEILPALLRRQTQEPDHSWTALAGELVSATLGAPLNSLPVPPFFGALEEPRETGWLRYGRLSVKGWLAHRTAKITRITALVDAVQESILLHGLPREDISGVFTDLPGSELSHFVGHVDLPASQSAPALVKVFAELDNGEKHLAFAQRFTPRVIAGADIALPPLSRATFARAGWALRSAASRYCIPLGKISDLTDGAKAAWAHYLAEAPAKIRRKAEPVAPNALGSGSEQGSALGAMRSTTQSHRPLRILVVTHNLNFEGAPWFIFELAKFLHSQPGASVHVVSPQDGSLRRVFTAAGMPVAILDLSAALKSESTDDFYSALAAATGGLPWQETDLVLCNTMVSFWAVHAAQRASLPVLMYVHESAHIRRFFAPTLSPALIPLIESAFREATRVVFTADSSRAVFSYLDERNNFVSLPSWVDVARVDAFAAVQSKAELRRKHGLDPDAVLIVNIGSICERKGQHIFIRTIELLKAELPTAYPGKKIQFVMVGARAGVYLELLKHEVAFHQLDNALFLPESGEIFDFYRLADIFVCTSFEESFPRVLLESAAFRLPIITTNVNGITEMLAEDEAWIIPPGDRYQLAEAIKQALNAHYNGDTRRVDKARAAIVRRYHEANSLPLHAALARACARPPASP